jgi:hypothetical protein
MMVNNGQVKILKKRGRKPKTILQELPVIKEELVESDKEVIIAYLPININEIENLKLDEKSETDIFIRSESHMDNKNSSECDSLSSTKNEIRNNSGKYLNKINVSNIECNPNTKCWWCKNIFHTPQVILPEQYYNDTFYCIGNFCSYNCAKAYNLDINDTYIWKRESLLKLLYYLTYGYNKEINIAPSWITLKEFGGYLNINEFRKNFEVNNINYLVLHPPIISRQMQIEESYKKVQTTQTSISKMDKLFIETDNLILKRSKPVESTKLNLETTMGLRRKIK